MASTLNDTHDASKVTSRMPWEIESEAPRAHLISRLRGAHDYLALHGFLTSRESLEIDMRINAWNDDVVRRSDAELAGLCRGSSAADEELEELASLVRGGDGPGHDK